MTTLNHNRNTFKKQEVWRRHDQYLPAPKRHSANASATRYAKLDERLLPYQGNDERLNRIRCARLLDESLTAVDQSWAFERLRAIERARQCWQAVNKRGCLADQGVAEALRGARAADDLGYGQLAVVEEHLSRCVGHTAPTD